MVKSFLIHRLKMMIIEGGAPCAVRRAPCAVRLPHIEWVSYIFFLWSSEKVFWSGSSELLVGRKFPSLRLKFSLVCVCFLNLSSSFVFFSFFRAFHYVFFFRSSSFRLPVSWCFHSLQKVSCSMKTSKYK